MGRRTLSKREIKELIPSISSLITVFPKQKLEIVTEDKSEIIFVDDVALLFKFRERWLPLLRLIISREIPVPYKKVTVDMGAVKFVANGADIMRPGITQIEDGIASGDPVLIVDETHGKTLALGVAMFSSEEMRAAKSGKVIKNAHAAGDALWEFTK